MNIKHLPYHIDESNRHHFFENHWKKKGLELLLKHCAPTGKTLLDYGCGRGESLKFAAEAGFSVKGTDTDAECVKIASQYGPACLLDVESPLSQFGEKSFDVITCFHVLEHVDNPKQVLFTLGRIAREFIVLAVPNLRYLHKITRRSIDIQEVNEGHLQGWDHWHLLGLAERHCNLELIEWGFDATILPFASNIVNKVLGPQATIKLECGLFKRLFPFHGISVLGLFRPKATSPEILKDMNG